jgi:hypothetical protein
MYERAQERVSKVLSALGLVWMSTIEVQGGSGDGWIHWHALVMVDPTSKLSDLRRIVWSKWKIREQYADAVVDQETGEELQAARFRAESLGRVDVQWARTHGGAARYAAKYMVKPWPAVPPWMLDDTRRFRKFRFSSGAYDVLEKLHLHDRQRGSRRIHKATPHLRRARPLRERMARSCMNTLVFGDRDGAKVFLGRLRVGIIDTATVPGVAPIHLGKVSRVRVSAEPSSLALLLQMQDDPLYLRSRRAEYLRRLDELDVQWSLMQERRRRRGSANEN